MVVYNASCKQFSLAEIRCQDKNISSSSRIAFASALFVSSDISLNSGLGYRLRNESSQAGMVRCLAQCLRAATSSRFMTASGLVDVNCSMMCSVEIGSFLLLAL